jgi:hypothetical protein
MIRADHHPSTPPASLHVLALLIKVWKSPRLCNAVHMPTLKHLITLSLHSLSHLVLEHHRTSLIITLHSWSSREHGIGRDRRAQTRPAPCQSCGERALDAPERQAVPSLSSSPTSLVLHQASPSPPLAPRHAQWRAGAPSPSSSPETCH